MAEIKLMRGKKNMNIERNYSGAWVIYSSDDAGYLVTRSYWGYNKREAVWLFRQYMKEINKWAPPMSET